jgi:hypothetical protein
MKTLAGNGQRVRLIVGLLAINCLGTALGQEATKPVAPAVVQKALDEFKAAGKDASLTVLPVYLDGSSSKQGGEVLGMLLERAGMQNLELGTAEFRPPEKADMTQTATALAEFVHANPVNTNYVLFAEFLGSHAAGVTEVRGVIVNKQGQLVWQERQTPEDADFKRIKPREPMDCCVLLAERLRPVLNLDDPARADAPAGKLAERWQQKTGVPNEAEREAIKERQAAFKQAAATATLLIYPAHAGDQMSPKSATHLAQMINEAKLLKATAADQGPQLEVKPDMNEQKMLWGMARAFSTEVQAHPPKSDYVLYADYLMGKNAVGGVHFAICDSKGQLVIVDFQNSHWDDFKAINPKSAEDCDRLVLKRLEGYCK